MSSPRVFHHGSTDSTNERAFAALAAGDARHGDVHVADAQSAGRGSRGRAWRSAPGEGLYASVTWMPPAATGRAARASPAAFTMAAGLAVRDALVGLGLAGVRLKWPNDVLVRDEKIAGILIEARGLDPARPAFVCGVGVNVAQRAFAAGLRRPATSLALHGVAIAPEALLARLLPHLEGRLSQANGDAPELAADFARAAELTGDVRVSVSGSAIRGVVVGFGLDGIALETAGGLRRLPLEHVGGVEPAAD